MTPDMAASIAGDTGHFVIVIPDGVDFDIECGLCGYTERNVATTEDGAHFVAGEHEATCSAVTAT